MYPTRAELGAGNIDIVQASPSHYASLVPKKPIDQVARTLAEAHRREDPATQLVLLSDDADEVRLIEVSGSVGTTGEVLPFRFTPDPLHGIDYPSVVILLSREDWERVERRELRLPEGWAEPRKIA